MSCVPNTLLTLNEASVKRKMCKIWNVLQETNNNLIACDQLLQHYSSRANSNEHCNLQNVSTQTSVPSKISSTTQTFVPSSVNVASQILSSCVNTPIHKTTQTTSLQNEVTDTGTVKTKDSITQTQSEQEAQSVGLRTQSCVCSLLSSEFEQNKCLRLCHAHYKAFRSCGDCEFTEVEDNKTTQTTDWMDTKMLQRHQKIVDCFSSLEQHCQDMDLRLGSMLSLLEMLTREMQSSITRVFEQKTGHDYQIKENETKFGEVLATEEHRQRAEVLESVVQSGYAEQEMQMLYRHLVQLEETLVAERDNVIQLHERRAYLSSQIKDAKCNLVEERVSMDSLFLQMVHLSQRNSFLRAKLSYSRAQYHCQLTNARQMLGCRNAKVNQLRRALVKVRDLCHSIDGGYQTVLWEIGKQIQLTAELIAREHGLEWSHRPTVTTLTAAGLREWYQQIQHTTMWIQLHILSCQNDIQHSSQEECNVTDRSSSVFPPQYMANQMCLSLTPVKADTSSLHVAGNNSDLSFDLELSLDMSNTVQLADKHKADLCSTTCSSLSQDLSRQRETPQDRYHMQHRFLTILDNLKVKLLQLTHSNVQGSNTAASIQ